LSNVRVYPLDRMSSDLRKASLIALGLVVALVFLSRSGPEDSRRALELAAAIGVGAVSLVWLAFRPTRFVLDEAGLRIEWPIRIRTIPRSAIAGARLVSAREFRRAHDLGLRIGAGGLFGTFGLLRGSRETFSIWVSRTDQWVLVRLSDGSRPLLLTPAHPEKFVAAIGALPADGVVSASRN
jgi:hypothetical protein